MRQGVVGAGAAADVLLDDDDSDFADEESLLLGEPLAATDALEPLSLVLASDVALVFAGSASLADELVPFL